MLPVGSLDSAVSNASADGQEALKKMALIITYTIWGLLLMNYSIMGPKTLF